MPTETKDQETIHNLKGAIVRTYATEFGYVKMTEQVAVNNYGNVAPLYGESEFGDWHGTMHNPVPEKFGIHGVAYNTGIMATNIHVSDLWMIEALEARFGTCYRVLDSDIHFFIKTEPDYRIIRQWVDMLPGPTDAAPQRARILGYPYGVRDGNPIDSGEGIYSIEHLRGRPDCHWYNFFPVPNAGGKSGSPGVNNGTKEIFGINTSRGSTWLREENKTNHWGIIQCYHNQMTFTRAE